jgi:dTDP-glucose 4,6-dehydratase
VKGRILVTGAAGFLGSHLCRALVEDGHARLVGLDTRRSPLLDRLGPRMTFLTGDVRSAALVEAALRDVDLVFHLAAIADPRACARGPELARAVNVGGTAAVVHAAAGRRLVFLSSATVYANSGSAVALAEDAPLGGTGVYAETKHAGEFLCREAAERGRLEAVIVRNFNTYGDGQADTYLVPDLVGQGLRERRVHVMSCRPVRDFTYVADAVAALVALGVSGVPGGVFNLGSGDGHSAGDIACEIARQLGVPSSCGHAPSSGNACLVAHNAKLQAAVGWRPAVTLPEGIARTIAWQKGGARAASSSSVLDRDGDAA